MAVPEGGMIVIERGSVNSKQWGFHDFFFIFDTDYCVCYLKILILMYMLLLYVSQYYSRHWSNWNISYV
jgi:hypothetical protein